MQQNKINLDSFCLNNLLAKHLAISLRYQKIKNELIEDRAKFDAFIKNQVKENFIFPDENFSSVITHLSLYLLGNENNHFSKITIL